MKIIRLQYEFKNNKYVYSQEKFDISPITYEGLNKVRIYVNSDLNSGFVYFIYCLPKEIDKGKEILTKHVYEEVLKEQQKITKTLYQIENALLKITNKLREKGQLS